METVGTINIEGFIGTPEEGMNLPDGMPHTTFLNVVKQAESVKDCDRVHLCINSPGGMTEEGDKIYDYLDSLPMNITTYAREVCASMATKLFMLGSRRVIYPNCHFEIHNPWGGNEGDANSHEEYASGLRTLEKKFVDFYAKSTGTSKEAIIPLMSQETVLSPQDAIELGFATELFELEVKAVAFSDTLKTKNKKMAKDADKNKLEKMMTSFMEGLNKIINKETKCLVLQDANATAIDFPDVEEGQEPSVGDTATVEGSPAEGEYTMPDGTVYVFAAGEVSEIRPVEEEESEEMAQLQETNTAQAARIEELETEKAKMLKDFKSLKKDFKKIKALSGEFEIDQTKKDPKKKNEHKARSLFKAKSE